MELDDLTQSHVCVFEDDDDCCLLCGAAAPIMQTGWEDSKGDPAAQTQHEALEKVKDKARAFLSQVPTSRSEWRHKPHYARLICVLCATLVFVVFLVLFVAAVNAIDSNECDGGDHDCSTDAVCTNLDGTYTCDCQRGYIGDGLTCADVDECSAAQMATPEVAAAAAEGARCHAEASCVNAPGSFSCTCADKYTATGDTCVDVLECATDNGGCGDVRYTRCVEQKGAAPLCEDVQECAADNGACGPAALVTCSEQASAAPVCADVDECKLNNGGCASGFRCVNQFASLPRCDDIDECQLAVTPCDAAWGVCVNQLGNFTCDCKPGYQKASPGSNMCEDINECATANGGCEHICNNAFGTHGCSCAQRYTLAPDKRRCIDDDECLVDNGGCGPTAFFTCINNGGFAPSCTGGFPACPPNQSQPKGPGAYVDCDGNCFADEHCTGKPWVGDGYCDRTSASATGVGTPRRHLNCSAWLYDAGDCGIALNTSLAFKPASC